MLRTLCARNSNVPRSAWPGCVVHSWRIRRLYIGTPGWRAEWQAGNWVFEQKINTAVHHQLVLRGIKRQQTPIPYFQICKGEQGRRQSRLSVPD